MVDIEEYELCIRKRAEAKFLFSWSCPTPAWQLDDVRKQLPKKLLQKIKEDRPKVVWEAGLTHFNQ